MNITTKLTELTELLETRKAEMKDMDDTFTEKSKAFEEYQKQMRADYQALHGKVIVLEGIIDWLKEENAEENT